MVVFEKCDRTKSSVKCDDEAEIEEWLRFKYLIGIYNSKNFVQHKFEEDRIEATSKVAWFPISEGIRIDYVIKLTRTRMLLNDSQFSFKGLMMQEDAGFTV